MSYVPPEGPGNHKTIRRWDDNHEGSACRSRQHQNRENGSEETHHPFQYAGIILTGQPGHAPTIYFFIAPSSRIRVSLPGCITIDTGRHSNPGTRLNVLSVGTVSNPRSASV